MPLGLPFALLLTLGFLESPLAQRSDQESESQRKQIATEVMKTWLKSQNDGDFSAYAKLYAPKFQGVKRSGARVRNYDRQGWLRDRAKMFSKPMTVSLENMTVNLAGSAAIVQAIQTWASGKYKDKGTKRFVLTRDRGGYVISKEVMLNSEIHSESKTLGGFLLVYAGEPVITAQVKPEWIADDKMRLHGYTVRAQVLFDKLPQSYKNWKGKNLTLLDKDGQQMKVQVTGFEVIYEAGWHFGTLQNWNTGEVSEAEMIQEITSSGATRLVLNLADHQGQIGENTQELYQKYVLASGEDVLPKTFSSFSVFRNGKEAEEDPLAEAVEAIVSEELLSRNGGIEVGMDDFEIRYASRENGKGEGWVYVIHSPPECQADVSGPSLKHGWSYHRGTPYQLRSIGEIEGYSLEPITAVDLDGDGMDEVVFQTTLPSGMGILKRKGNALSIENQFEIPNYDCGC